MWYAVWHVERHREAIIHFFDIGQGDAIFITTPNGNQILIDGGPSRRILSKLGDVMPFYDRSIDLVVLTHPHLDHLGGLLEVIKRYDVGMILESSASYTTAEYHELRRLVQSKRIKTIVAKRDQRVLLDTNITLDVLSPFEHMNTQLKNIHDAMVVTKLTHASTSILLMGDAGRMIEFRLLFQSLEAIDVDILKVGHHGSKTSSIEEFLNMVSPETAVVSVGRNNRYRHPHGEVLERFETMQIPLLRTDINGDITITSDGMHYAVTSSK